MWSFLEAPCGGVTMPLNRGHRLDHLREVFESRHGTVATLQFCFHDLLSGP